MLVRVAKMLHEVIFALGGLPSSLFTDDVQNMVHIYQLHPGEVGLLVRVIKIATLHRNVLNFIHGAICKDVLATQQFITHSPGLYFQSFCIAAYKVLESYRHDIVEIEKNILEDPTFTLSNIVYKVEQHSDMLVLLNTLIRHIKRESVHGCQILALIYCQISTGILSVREIGNKILYECHGIFFRHLSCWIMYGCLTDTYKEFFIEHGRKPRKCICLLPRSNKSERCVFCSGIHICSPDCNYTLNINMIPSYISIQLAKRILYIGQIVLLFGKDPKARNPAISESYAHHMPLWNGRYHEIFSRIVNIREMQTFSKSLFEETIDDIHQFVTYRLWDLTVVKANLFLQLKLVKDFFLIGYGELFLEFIPWLDPVSLKGRSCTEYINYIFRNAAHKVHLKDELLNKFTFVIDKDSVHINEMRGHNEQLLDSIDWDSIRLEYTVEWPLYIFFTQDIINKYNELFRFLLRVRRVQASLHRTWMKQMLSRKINPESMSDPLLWELRTLLTFLIDNLQYYFQTDIVHTQYNKMLKAIQSTKDFREIQVIHAKFLTIALSSSFIYSCKVIYDSEFDGGCNCGGNGHHDLAYPVCVCHDAVGRKGGGGDPDDRWALQMSPDMYHNPVHDSIVCILELAEEFCDHEITWDGPLDDEEYSEMLTIAEEFGRQMHFLMRIFQHMHTQGNYRNLSQILLRLDFNCWFTKTTAMCFSFSDHS